MVIKKELIKREIAGDTILIPARKAVLDSHGLFALNEVGAFIWDMLPNVENESEICKAILTEYDVSAEEAALDVSEFLANLRNMGII